MKLLVEQIVRVMTALKTVKFFDTSALLAGFKLNQEDINYISTIVFSELENIKTSYQKDEIVKYKARVLIRYLMDHQDLWTEPKSNWRKINRLLKHSPELQDNNDSKLICEAVLLARKSKERIEFVTADSSQFFLACKFIDWINPEYYKDMAHKEGLWKGFKDIDFGSDEQALADYYEHPETNALGLEINEYAALKLNNEIVDLVKWDGNKNEVIKYKNQNSDYFGQVKPLNDQQRMLFDLLQNRNIPVKTIRGQFGSGKTFLALVHAMNYVKWHTFDKIVYVRNNVEVAGSQKLGALPGEQDEKLMPWLMPLADHLGGPDALIQAIDNGEIEPVHLGYLRGRNFQHSIIFVDEAENLTTDNVKLIIARAEKDSEVWFLGDESQTDSDIFRKNSGIASLLNSLQGEPLFGAIELQKSERSEVAQLAAKIHGES